MVEIPTNLMYVHDAYTLTPMKGNVMMTVVICKTCNGTGSVSATEPVEVICEKCRGRGKVSDSNSGIVWWDEKCDRCNGTGKVTIAKTVRKPCPDCKGTGRVEQETMGRK